MALGLRGFFRQFSEAVDSFRSTLEQVQSRVHDRELALLQREHALDESLNRYLNERARRHVVEVDDDTMDA